VAYRAGTMPAGSAPPTVVVMSAFGAVGRAIRHHPYGPRTADLAVAAVACAAMVFTTPPDRMSVAAALTALASCGPLLGRRSRPFAVLAMTMIGAAIYSGLTVTHGFALAAPMVALYTAAEATGRRRALTIGWLTVLVFAGIHAVLRAGPAVDWQNLAVIALGGLAVVAGDAARSRRAYVAQVEERARRAEYDREQEARRRVTEERLRIARELHDVVGHQLALINVQAGVAAHVLVDRPDQARQALAHIRQASRAGLAELRDTIGLLREPGEPAAPTEPTVGLSGLDDLVASFARSGMRIERDVDGTACALPPIADLTAYRIVQESLTNVRKHADGAATRLRLSYGPTGLRILVENDDPGAPAATGATGGLGIAGMRERVAAVGGSLDAGPRPGGGFRVSAVLPLPGGRRS
jgi:signal transduction histidine kinase